MTKYPDNFKEKKAFDYFREEEIKSSYKYFKKFFKNSIFLSKDEIKVYAIKKALEKHKANFSYLEFGVFRGKSINLFAKILKKSKSKIYGFDSFEGLNEDWVEVQAGDFLWLRAFCPQACYAGGTEDFRYLLYKDVNRQISLS